MALWAISDLHLPLGVDKPMDIFGKNWKNYVERLYNNWQENVADDDMVVLAGDFSWATYIEDAKKDFDFLNKLKGRKILIKGNHDYWWETITKMNRFVEENGYETISFMQNNSYLYKDVAICGTRGWNLPVPPYTGEENMRYYNREIQRLSLSLESAPKDIKKIVFTHFPPIANGCIKNDFTEVLNNYGVEKCLYGHLHAKSSQNAINDRVNGVEYLLVSCDYLEFEPMKLLD